MQSHGVRSVCLTAGVAALCGASTALAGQVKQTDWSAAGGARGPVLHWSGVFSQQAGVAWRSIAGQVALAGMQRAQAMRTVVAEDADLPRGAAVGDFDGDGRSDVVIGDPVTDPFNPVGAVHWWHSEENGTFTRRVVSDTFYGTNDLTTGDVDGDGDTDIVVAAYYGAIDPPPPPPERRNGRYAWFENVYGDGSVWEEHVVGELYWGAEYVDVGDFDGDGDMDLVGASYLTLGGYEQESDITWFENLDGGGLSWQMHEVSGQFDNGYEAHFADLDGDGDLDILGTHADLISWWENTSGHGDVLQFHLITSSLQNVGYVDVGDIDNDGDLDVVGSTYSAPSLFWWENLDRSATLWAVHGIGAHPSGERVELVDIEGDGDLDVVADRRDGSSSVLTLFTNVSGDGTAWSGRVVQRESNTDYSIATGDADSDGKIDVVVASEDYYRVLGKQVSYFDLSTFGSAGILVGSILDGGTTPGWGVMTWDADSPNGTSLAVEVRASDSDATLGAFVGVPGPGTDISTLINPNARYLQYRLSLTGGGDLSPVLRELNIDRAGGGNGLVLAGPSGGTAGEPIELVARSDQVGAKILFAGAGSIGPTPIPPCPGLTASLAAPTRLGATLVDASGEARQSALVPPGASGRTLYSQALDLSNCVVSNVIAVPFE